MTANFCARGGKGRKELGRDVYRVDGRDGEGEEENFVTYLEGLYVNFQNLITSFSLIMNLESRGV